MNKFIFYALAFFLCNTCFASDTLRALFIGNSYTEVNNLPDMVSKLASAGGDSLYYQVSAPGGQTFEQHCTNSTTLSLIAQGDWDFVVLQEQSQRPSFHDGQVAAQVYPFAKILDSLIHESSPCAKTVFYMTWGRKNGDASNCAGWPPVCTYEGMDSLLQLRYTIMAGDNESVISPVAKVWRNLRDNNPSLELYQPDESHPSVAGTYAAALSFYSLFFAKDATTNSYISTLNTSNATIIKNAAKVIVFDSIHHWRRFHPYPRVDAINISNTSSNTITATGVNPENIVSYEWDFGDGSLFSVAATPTHTYAVAGTYEVCLTVSSPCDQVRYCKTVTVGPTTINYVDAFKGINFYPNPTNDYIKATGLMEPLQYTVINYIGSKISSGTVDGNKSTISLKSLPAGIYFLNLSNRLGQKKTLKVVKQ